MKAALIAVTRNGVSLSQSIRQSLRDDECTIFALEKFACEGCVAFASLARLTADVFREYDALVYLCACGIAVRMVAPHISTKRSDPAVIVIDERGQFVISLLSGHLGGANELARRISRGIGAVPVITTATDAGGRFSPDLFAAANRLYICDLAAAKAVASAIVDGRRVGLRCDYPFVHLPDELDTEGTHEVGICISGGAEASPFAVTLHLLPKNIIVGAGCRKGIAPEVFERLVLEGLAGCGVDLRRLAALHTIECKKDEPAMKAFCAKFHIPMRTFTAAELMHVRGTFSSSDFVMKTVGADNVCERAAAIGGSIILQRHAAQGVTFAAAEGDVLIDFGRMSVE